MVLTWKRMACSLQVRGEDLPQVEKFKYLGVLFTSDGKRDCEIGRRTRDSRNVVTVPHCSSEEGAEPSVYIPTLSYLLWVMTERRRSQIPTFLELGLYIKALSHERQWVTVIL